MQMKKIFKFILILLAVVAAITGVLFVVYITNADSKLIEFIYDKLAKYHESKKVEDHI